MLKEVAHFARYGPELARLRKQLGAAPFMDVVAERGDPAGLAEQRRALVADLAGKVLEVGCGTGAMFAFYGPGVAVEAIEPDAEFREAALSKANAVATRIRATDGDAMRLAFPDASFDAVVLGMVLCSVPSIDKVLAEVRRVLRPGGALRVLEHVRSHGIVAGPLMSLFNPAWRMLNKQGCNMNRRPQPLIERAGFTIEAVHEFQIFARGLPAFPMQRIHARRTSTSVHHERVQ